MSRRDYSDAVRWLRSARPRTIRTGAFAFRSFGGAFVVGLVVLGAIAVVTPERFGFPGRRVLAGGAWTWALLGIVGVGLLGLVLRRRYLIGLYRRVVEPFRHPYTGDAAFEGAADSLAQCSEALQTRWAVSWIYVPAAFVVVGIFGAFSSAYFVISAVLAAGRIDWYEPTLAWVNALVSIVGFASGAVRLSTWRLAIAVHREVTGRYLDRSA